MMRGGLRGRNVEDMVRQGTPAAVDLRLMECLCLSRRSFRVSMG